MGMHFLIEHDRHGKTLTRITPFEELEKAEQALTKLDLTQLPELNRQTLAGPPLRMEYLIITTKSRETLKYMYPRFFWNPAGYVWNDHNPHPVKAGTGPTTAKNGNN